MYNLSVEENKEQMAKVHMQICELEDDILEMKMRYDELDDMSEDNSQFNEDEFDNLEGTIEMKNKMLDKLREKMQEMTMMDKI